MTGCCRSYFFVEAAVTIFRDMYDRVYENNNLNLELEYITISMLLRTFTI